MGPVPIRLGRFSIVGQTCTGHPFECVVSPRRLAVLAAPPFSAIAWEAGGPSDGQRGVWEIFAPGTEFGADFSKYPVSHLDSDA